MNKHNFVESSGAFGVYHRIIYCNWCGVVIWNFNRTEDSVKILQLNAQTVCKANTEALKKAQE